MEIELDDGEAALSKTKTFPGEHRRRYASNHAVEESINLLSKEQV